MLNRRSRKARKARALPCENPHQIIFVEAAFPGFPIWEGVANVGYPSPHGLLESSIYGEFSI